MCKLHQLPQNRFDPSQLALQQLAELSCIDVHQHRIDFSDVKDIEKASDGGTLAALRTGGVA